MSKDAEKKALVPAEAAAGPIQSASIREFLGKFDMSMEPTPENVEMTMQQIEIIGRMVHAMDEVGLVERGKRFIYLKTTMQHGQWEKCLKERFGMIPARTIRWWMAEARYFMEHGRRKTAALPFSGQIAAGFTDADGEELDADDLADPTKPAPLPRSELENRLQRLEKRLSARDRREEKLLEQVASLENRLREEKARRDPDAMEEQAPIKTALLKTTLSLGRAIVLMDEYRQEGRAISADCSPRLLASLTSRIRTTSERLQEFAGQEVLAFAKAHNEEKRRREAEEKKDGQKSSTAGTN